jgi:hypothetical protein
MEYAKYKNEIEKEYLLNIEIQKQNLKSLPNYENIPRKLDPITQEMIDDYNIQFRPMRDGKRYKYFKPAGKVILENIDDLIKQGKIDEPFSDAELQYINDRMNNLVKERKTLLSLFTVKKKQLTDYKNKTKKSPEVMKTEIEKQENNLKQITDDINDLARDIIYYQNEITKNNKTKYDFDMMVAGINTRNERKLNEYKKTLNILNDSDIELNQKTGESEQEYLDRLENLTKIEYETPERAKLYNINEFKKNMKEIIFTEWKVENILKSLPITDIFMLNKTFPKFKQDVIEVFGINNLRVSVDEYIYLIKLHLSKANSLNVLGITSSNNTASSKKPILTVGSDVDYSNNDMYDVDKSVDYSKNDLDDLDKTTMYDSVYKLQKKSDKDVEELTSSLNDLDTSGKKSKPIDDSLNKSSSKEDETPIKYDLSKDKKTLRIKKGTSEVYFKINEVVIKDPKKFKPKTAPIVLYTYSKSQEFEDIKKFYVTNAKNKSFADRIKLILVDNVQFSEKEFNQFIKDSTLKGNDKPTPKGLFAFLQMFKLKLDEKYPIQKQTASGIKKKKIIIKKGAKLKQVPKHCEFGKLVILLNKLYHSNMLSIKDKNNINVQGLPNTKVSDDFVNLIMKICTNKDVIKNDVYNLDQKEIILYNILISKAGLSKKYEIDVKKTVKILKDRLTLLEGEIQAGNNNNDLKKELYDVIFKLSNIGAIPVSSARKYYNDTVKTYF